MKFLRKSSLDQFVIRDTQGKLTKDCLSLEASVLDLEVTNSYTLNETFSDHFLNPLDQSPKPRLKFLNSSFFFVHFCSFVFQFFCSFFSSHFLRYKYKIIIQLDFSRLIEERTCSRRFHLHVLSRSLPRLLVLLELQIIN